MRIDHVVLGSRDLDATAERFWERYGLASVDGGRHQAWGTANRIVPLGDDYVEFLAVTDPASAAASRFGRFLAELTADGDRWFTVCIADDDLDRTAARLGLEVASGGRRRPDGTEVRWRSAGLEDPAREPWLPFFIEWQGSPEIHPGRMGAPAHRVAPRRIAWVEMAGDASRLRTWLGDAQLPIRTVEGTSPGIRSVGLATGGGEVVLER